MIDAHIHVGQFFKLYISPKDIKSIMNEVGVDQYAVSSTTICEHHYSKALDEIIHLKNNDSKKCLPILWITPQMLIDNKEAMFIDSGVEWRAIKIHPGLNPGFWQKETAVMDYVADIAKDLCLPIFIHTGLQENCEASTFKETLNRHPNINFILAHGRPLDQTINIINTHNNVWADSAFMPIQEMATFIKAGLSTKLLWGTDMCIHKHYYPNVDMVDYYKRKLKAFSKVCTTEQYADVTYRNAKRLFGIF